MNTLSKIYRCIYVKIFRDPIEELAIQTRGCSSILDIGCGNSSPVQFCSKRIYKVGVDAYLPSIKESRKKKIHNKYYHITVDKLGKIFKDKSFDCVIAYDLIEHLKKTDGQKLITEMERIARKKVIIFTPNGFMKQGAEFGNDFQRHLSGWSWIEMRRKGYDVKGMHGYKPLRGDFALPKYKPRLFWMVICDITQLVTRHLPKYAFHILCIKNFEKKKQEENNHK